MGLRLRMLLPASALPSRTIARDSGEALGEALGDVEVAQAASYDEMERALIGGLAQLAWAPPLVSARVESYGGRLVARAVRRGSASYRSALLTRRGSTAELAPNAGLRAAWVDRESMGGYVLPQVLLHARGLSSWEVFAAERFVGSYARSREEVLADRADIACAAVHSASREGAAREVGREMAILGISEPCTNDGIVAAPSLPREECERVAEAVVGLHAHVPALIQEIFEAERFDPAPAGTFREVYRLLFAALPGSVQRRPGALAPRDAHPG